MKLQDFSSLQKIPGYDEVLKAVLKSQIQILVDQLCEHTGEESLILTASTAEGTLCHLGSDTGQGFLLGREEIKSQFLAHCLKEKTSQNGSQAQYPLYYRNFDTHAVQDTHYPTASRHQKRKQPPNSPVHPVSLTKVNSESEIHFQEFPQKKIRQNDSDTIDDTIGEKNTVTKARASVPVLNLQAVLVEEVKCIGNTGEASKPLTVESKDKSIKKTLSSKIDEITERIKKDETQKLQCDEGLGLPTNCCVLPSISLPINVTVPSSMTIPTVGQKLVPDADGFTEICNGPQEEIAIKNTNKTTYVNASKLKDVSRASHRKPKLPRFNIGVASDDEDNEITISTETTTAADIVADEMLNISVNLDDTDTSFTQVSLDELGDGVLLKENVTDIPIVGYYNGDHTNKAVIENVFNLKSSRNRESKMARTSESIIVSGSSSEKRWVKCSMCPEKFPSQEWLTYHLQNVVHTPKKFECDFCGRTFGQLRDMERHRRIHTGERPFKCDICEKAFARKDNLKSHKMKHYKQQMKLESFISSPESKAQVEPL